MSATTSKVGSSGTDSSTSTLRLYVDESGDGSPTRDSDLDSQYLCLLGCIFEDQPYRSFHDQLESLRRSFFIEHHPDNPVVLHRTDIVNGRGAFLSLQDEGRRAGFDQAVLDLVNQTNFRLIASIIDKNTLGLNPKKTSTSPTRQDLRRALDEEIAASIIDASALAADLPAESSKIADCYGHAYRQLLSAYSDLLDFEAVKGCIIMEARGGKQDAVLRQIHEAVLKKGIGERTGLFFRERLFPAKLDLRAKVGNVSGLQLADILCHSMKCWILRERSVWPKSLGRFTELLIAVFGPLLSNHQVTHRPNYGYVLCPKLEVKSPSLAG